MRGTIAATIVALALAGLTGCGATKDQPSAAACEAAMRGQLASSIATGSTGSKPPACDGLSDDQLERIGTAVLGDTIASGAGACEAALRSQVETDGELGEQPSACEGADRDELDAIGERIVEDAKSGKLKIGGQE